MSCSSPMNQGCCEFPAHIRPANEQFKYQSVADHCRQVAKYASASLSSLNLASTGYLAGLIHDMGKYTPDFAYYIEKAAREEPVVRGSVNHTFAAVIFLLERYHTKEHVDLTMMTCEILAFAVGSHHGEFDCVDLNRDSGFEHRLNKDKESICYPEAMRNFISLCASLEEIDRLFLESVAEIERMYKNLVDVCGKKKTSMTFTVGMLARLILSTLIDADRRDTAEFMTDKKFATIVAGDKLWDEATRHLESKLSLFQSDAPINEARSYFSETCHKLGRTQPFGVYRLTLPTGAGKTISSLRYALSNAKTFNKRRIIFVIPLLSILEQNSAVIRDYIGNDNIVTEHHSNFIKDFISPEELDEYELLTQTWDSPIIITTLVQLLNTLFSGKTSSIRRMNALSDSVIVIDEIQSLPKKTLYMFNATINFLAYVCGATIVLSSATQPVFDEMTIPIRFTEPADIVPYDPARYTVFQRTRIHDCTTQYGRNIEELGDFCSEKFEVVHSLLVICNTKSTAVKLFDHIRQTHRDAKVFHLSASMCMKHRMDTLKNIKDCLTAKEPVICVSTQIVEAGVDFSFQRVIRVLAGMDNVAQAAGRCNRNGEYGKLCDVFIVNLKAGDENLNMLKEIYASQRSTTALLYSFRNNAAKYNEDLISEKSVHAYYETLFQDPDIKSQFEYRLLNSDGRELRLFRLLADNSELAERDFFTKYFLNQSFKTAGTLFEVFDENTTDILVPYDETAEKLIADLLSEKAKWNKGFMGGLVEQAKPYLIRIFEYQKRQLSNDGMLYSDPTEHFMILNKLRYCRESGLKSGDVFF